MQVAQLVWASEPIAFGSAFISIYGFSVFMRFVSDIVKPGKFHMLSELSNDRCSCSSLYMILYRESRFSSNLSLFAIDKYINSTAWVLCCLFND